MRIRPPSDRPRRRRLTPAGVTTALAAGLVAVVVPLARAADPVTDVPAVSETAPSPITGDSVDDMAVWANPDDPAGSLIIGADHANHSLDVYNLAGERLSSTDVIANNVDLRTGFNLAGQTVPLLGVAGSGNVRFYRLDPATKKLENVTKGGNISVTSAHGMCLYHSAVSGDFFAFAVNRAGIVTQYKLVDEGGEVSASSVRTIDLDPRVPADANGNDALEGCAADDQGASVFVGEQDWHIWRYGAEPTDPTGTSDRHMVDSDITEDGHFDRDVEGLTVVNEANGPGYLLASSQGDFTFNVYRRTAPYEFVRKVRITKSATSDGCERTDGIDAVAADLGPDFPRGVFICQDNSNTEPAAGNMNFKLARLEQVVPLADPGPPAPSTTTTTTAPAGGDPQDPPPGPGPGPAGDGPRPSGYWMLGSGGKVFAFGDAAVHGEPAIARPARAVDIEPTPDGKGYWVVDDRGAVYAYGSAAHHGGVAAAGVGPGEGVTSLAATPTGGGYWIFTSLGRAYAFGDAKHLGDMAGTRLNGPVLDSIPTPTGRGYYMVGSDGGIFAFGDARFFGSMGGKPLNQPVQSLVPDPDGAGYWLVASDGGVFAFEAGFRGSMGGKPLNKPVTGMVPFGSGYLMVGEDGGIFNFSDRAFHGSLGDKPPADPITSVAALD